MAAWSDGFARIPNESWTNSQVTEFAQGYDRLAAHGWYQNLDPTIAAVSPELHSGRIIVDYSGGAGILVDRLLAANAGDDYGILIVDASSKFLRLALEKHRNDERVGFRCLPFDTEQHRLRTVDEVVGLDLLGGVAGIVSANAVHLYDDVMEVLQSWHRILRPGGKLWIQSGNMARRDAPKDHWIIDGTVHAIAAEARKIVNEDETFAAYADVLSDEKRMAAHDALRDRFFLPARGLEFYLEAITLAGFDVTNAKQQPVKVDLAQWLDFLSVYHDGIVGWVGGSPRVEGNEPDAAAIEDRRRLIKMAGENLFGGDAGFTAEWNHIEAIRVND